MKIVIVTAFSPRFNHIPSKRTEKLAKYLSREVDTTLICGMPNIPVNSPYFKELLDIGNSKLVEIIGKPLSKKFKQNYKNVDQLFLDSTLISKIKRNVGPFIELLIPISSGGMILYRKKDFIDAIDREIKNSSHNKIVLFTTYNPWFITQIGYQISKKTRVTWIADFRDPPFDSPHQKTSYLPYFKRITSTFLHEADLITTVNKNMIGSFKKIYNDDNKYMVLTNGFDSDDLKRIMKENNFDDKFLDDKLPEKTKNYFWIVYTGRFYPGSGGDLEPFAKVLSLLKTNQPFVYAKVKFVYAGSQSNYVESVFNDYEIKDSLIDCGQVSRDDALRLQSKGDLLLLVSYTGKEQSQGSGMITGKVFEYFMHLKPILVIGSEQWELKKELLADGKSAIYQVGQEDKIADYIAELINDSEIKDIKSDERIKNVREVYSYEKLAQQLLEKLEKFIDNKKD